MGTNPQPISMFLDAKFTCWLSYRDMICFICTESKNLDQRIVFSQCGHEICQDCLQSWVKIVLAWRKCPTCPFCRGDIIFRPADASQQRVADKVAAFCREKFKSIRFVFVDICLTEGCPSRRKIDSQCKCSDHAKLLHDNLARMVYMIC